MTNLSDDTILYRAISYPDFIDDDGDIDATAFKRRWKGKLQKYEDNLSAALKPDDSYNRLNRCYGVISLRVGDLRELGLDAIQDKSDHVSIINVPHPDNEEEKANIIGRKLAKKADIVVRWTLADFKKIKHDKLDWRSFIQ